MDALFLTWPAIAAQLLIAALSLLVWRRYLSPLADIPGPFVASFSRWWHIDRILIGDQNLQLVQLHEKHGTSHSLTNTISTISWTNPSITGPFVRIAHDEVSVSHPDSIKLILDPPLRKVTFSTGHKGRNRKLIAEPQGPMVRGAATAGLAL